MAPSIMLRYLTLTLVAAAASARVIMDSLAATPKGWEAVRMASLDEAIFLRIALKQQRGDTLDQAVLEMSTPGHPNYGMHMTRDEVRSYTSPSDAAISATTQWLSKHGIQPVVDHDWISFITTVRTANELLDTQFAWYQYSQGNDSPKLRALSYSVPDQVAQHIDLVQPTTRFGNLGARKSTIFEVHRFDLDDAASGPANKINLAPAIADGARCDTFVTPECLKTMYNIHYTPPATADNKIAFGSFLEEYARYDDLRLFQSAYAPGAIGQNLSVELVNGGLDDQNSDSDSMEANLDAQYIFGISHPIPIVEYSTAGRGPLVPTKIQPTPPGSNEPYLEWLLYLAGLPDAALPQTISVSYGEEEQSIPREYALKVCDMFKELGARGVSVLFSSGDSGPGDECVSNTDNNTTFFEPSFPAGCPWVTAVGGTTGGTVEKAVAFSSGGFSLYHDQPVWQKNAVTPFLTALGDTYAPFFNRSGRGFPDISAQAYKFVIYDKGVASLIGGTSASCPVVAGIVALLNAARKAQGSPPLGFLNPWLYNNSAAFNDIVSGAGVGCRSRAEFGASGALWNATAGWDPVTGLGTPIFDKLLEAAAPGTANV